MAESEEKLKNFLIRVKEESEKAGLKLNIQKLRPWCDPSWQIKGEKTGAVTDFLLGGTPKSLWMVTIAMKLEDTWSLKESYVTVYWKAETSLCQQSSVESKLLFFQKWKLDHKKVFTLKKWCFWIVGLKKTLETLGQKSDQTSQS